MFTTPLTRHPMMRALPVLLMLWGCDKEVDEEVVACDMAAENLGCPECADGDVTCSLDGIEASALSCGGCQARVALIISLCAADSTATREEIENATCVMTE